MSGNAWSNVGAVSHESQRNWAMAVFRCTACATIEQANGTLLSEFATFDKQSGWTTPCPICGGTAVLEGMVRLHDHHQIRIQRAGQEICLPASLIGPIAELMSLNDALE
jgi:hypothetical protein